MTVRDELRRALEFVENVSADHDPYDLILAREDDQGDSNETEYEFGRVATVGELPLEFGSFIREKLEKKISALESGSKEGTTYSASNIRQSNDVIQWIEPDNIPRFSNFDELITRHQFPTTRYEVEEGNTPEFQAILVRSGTGERLIAFQDFTKAQILGRKSRFRIFSQENRYRQFEDTLLEIPNRIDAVYYDDSIIVFDQRKFERIFDYMDEFKDVAETTTTDIVSSNVPIHSEQMFVEAAKAYPNAVRMMQEVNQRELWDHDDVDMDLFEYIIDEYGLSINTDTQNGTKGIVMDDKRQVWEVIHLYNDDHLDSPITEVGYQVDGKEARTNSSN